MRKLVLPAVRPATADEIAEHEKALMEIAAEDAFADRIQEPQTYDMSIEEHNLALMLLFYSRNCPIPYLRIKLNALLDESPYEGADASADALRLYTDVKKHFSSEISRSVGNSTRTVLCRMVRHSMCCMPFGKRKLLLSWTTRRILAMYSV